MKILQPPHWVRPKGYSNGISTSGDLVVTAGMVGWDEHENFVSENLAEQAAQTFKNITKVLQEAGAKPEHIIRLTWYIVDKVEYQNCLKEIGLAYQSVFGKHFPAMAVVEVSALMEEKAKIEIEATAVIPK